VEVEVEEEEERVREFNSWPPDTPGVEDEWAQRLGQQRGEERLRVVLLVPSVRG
jgi:hypothetical protein